MLSVSRYSPDIDSGNIRIGFLVYDASGVYINVGLGTYQGIVDLKDQIGGAQFIKRTQQTDNAIGKQPSPPPPTRSQPNTS